MGKPDSLLQEIFRVKDRNFSVFLFHHQLAWCPQKKGGEDMSEWMNVKLKDILWTQILHKVETEKLKSGCCFPLSLSFQKKNSSYPCQVLEVTFAQQVKDSEKLVEKKVEFHHTDSIILNQWEHTIQLLFTGFARPQNLLFFINPFGGRRKALSIEKKHIQPLLSICQVKSTVVHTQRQNHVADVLSSMSDEELSAYDAVVAVGGDGTICEVVNGLLTRKLDKRFPLRSEDLESVSIPIAVIAAGSTNALAYTLHGTDDPRTGVIHLLLGSPLPLDVASVQNDSGILRFIIGQLSYGYLADTMLHSEKLRWMGPKRYDYSGFRKFLSHALYQGSIDIRQTCDEIRKVPTQCCGRRGCQDCTASTSSSSNGEWKSLEGNFIGISAANMSLRCPMSPLGMAPFAHLSDGCMELILVRKASRVDHLRYLLRLAGDSRRTFAMPFVERYRVQEFAFTPTQCNQKRSQSLALIDIPNKADSYISNSDPDEEKAHSFWNCDGELLFQPAVRVRVHSNLIRILAKSNVELHAKPFGSGDLNENSQCATLTSSVSFTTRSPSVLTEELDAAGFSTDMYCHVNQTVNDSRF